MINHCTNKSKYIYIYKEPLCSVKSELASIWRTTSSAQGENMGKILARYTATHLATVLYQTYIYGTVNDSGLGPTPLPSIPLHSDSKCNFACFLFRETSEILQNNRLFRILFVFCVIFFYNPLISPPWDVYLFRAIISNEISHVFFVVKRYKIKRIIS
jgi:hypothetical protein